jgi:hypothetical protein
MSHVLDQMQGKTLYRVGYTQLLDTSMPMSDLQDVRKRIIGNDLEVANLTPLKVEEARMLPQVNAFVVKVALPDGRMKMLYGDLNWYKAEPGGQAHEDAAHGHWRRRQDSCEVHQPRDRGD